MEFAKNAYKKNAIYCYDCGKGLKVENKEIIGGKMLFYDDSGEKIKVFKCSSCFSKNPGLNSFRKCEVYSRVVGYLRPVGQWNMGKKMEYEDRKEFKAVGN